MKFKEYIVINELSLVAKEDEYTGGLMKLSSVGLKGPAPKIFKELRIPLTSEVKFMGFNKNIKPDKTIIHDSSSKNKPDDCFIQCNDNIYCIVTPASVFQLWWAGLGGGKADTAKTTKLKETISMYLCKNPGLTENDVIEKINKNEKEISHLYRTIYYTSGKEHSKLFKQFGLSSNMHLELQGGEYSDIIYDMVKHHSKISSKDNWNPGDMWAFTKRGIRLLKEFKPSNILEINDFIKNAFNSKDIVSISLKQVKKSGILTIIDPTERPAIPYDLTIQNIDIAESFKSIFFNTSSGFSLKGNMRSSATTLSLNIETYMKAKGYSNGAVPSFLWDQQKKNYRGVVYSGSKTPKVTLQEFENYRKIFKKYKSLIKNNKDYILKVQYDTLDEITKKRYSIIATTLDFVMSTKDIMEFCYYSSMKIHDEASIYVKFA